MAYSKGIFSTQQIAIQAQLFVVTFMWGLRSADAGKQAYLRGRLFTVFRLAKGTIFGILGGSRNGGLGY
jgi:hypothetical protein